MSQAAMISRARLGGVLALLVLALLAGCGPSRLELDNEQGRLDEAAPVVEGQTTVGQTFVSHRGRLSAVEVLLVVYGESGSPDGELTFHLRTDPTSSVDLVTQTFETRNLSHNQNLRVSFDPLPDSNQRSYFFFFQGSTGSQVTVWYNTIDAYREGAAIFDGRPQAGDLQFKTFYDYSASMVLRDVARGAIRRGALALPLAALLLWPGYLALLLAVPADKFPDPMMQIVLAVGLSVALWPLVLLFATLLGLTLTPARLAVLLALAGVAGVGRLWSLDWRPLAPWRDRSRWPALAVFGALLLLTLALRMLQARNLVVPAWVDGVHHTMIAQLIADQGQVPVTYRPYLDVGLFHYHFGFHTLAAALAWLTGLSVPRAVLVMGQVLNALVGVGVYGLTVALMRYRSPATGERGCQAAGLVAMGIVGMVSLMPAYYVTWGRYTQLTGLVVLPAAAILTLEWVERGRRWRLVLAALAVAGLGLVHYRVLVLYATFVVALLIYRFIVVFLPEDEDKVESASTPAGDGGRVTDYVGRLAVLAGASLILLAPWIVRLLAALVPTGRGAGWFSGEASFNAVPRALIGVGYDRVLLRLALLSLLLGVLWWRQISLLFGLWIAGAVLVANPNLLGGRETWLVSNAVLVITLFLPVAVLSGVLVGRLADLVFQWLAGRWRMAAAGLMVAAFLGVMLAGAWHNLDVVNPVTVVATQDDVDAMAWIRENTPPDAGFVTNVRLWQFQTYMGADGGYWIPLLTGRRTLVPPAIYTFGSRDYYFQVQDTLDTLARITAAGAPALRDLMSRHNLEYVYLGAKGGHLDLKSFLDDANYETVYSNGPVWIFRVRENTMGATN